jgi:hypothetical protein
MAKVVAQFDTVEKTLTVTEDGKAVANVYGAEFCRGYSYDGDEVPYCCSVMTMTEDADNKLMRMTRLTAAEAAPLQPTTPAPAPAGETKPDVAADIASYLGK